MAFSDGWNQRGGTISSVLFQWLVGVGIIFLDDQLFTSRVVGLRAFPAGC